MLGMNVTKISAIIIAIKNGNSGFIISDTDTLATPAPTNNIVPTGGVQSPIHKLSTMMIPKCTGCIPNSVTTGKNIGVNISIAGVISIKVPTISNVIFISKNSHRGTYQKHYCGCGFGTIEEYLG